MAPRDLDPHRTAPGPDDRRRQARRHADKAAERGAEELARALALTRATLDCMVDGLFVTDHAGRITYWNENLKTLWGMPDEVLESGQHGRLIEFVSRRVRDPGRFLAGIDRIRSSSPEETRDILEIDDGRAFERVTRTQFVDGVSTGRVWTFRDITDRQRAEDAQLRLAAVIETSDDAIVSKTLDGVVRTWNQGAERIFGYSADDMVGKPIHLLLPVERRHEEDEILRRLQAGERVDHFETVRVRKDGRRIDVSVTISPMRDASGRIVGASKIARDITGRKRAERIERFLADASEILAQVTDYASTLQKIADLSVPVFSDWCMVDMRDAAGTVQRVAIAHSDPVELETAWDLARRYPHKGDEPHGPMKVVRTGQAEWIPEITDEILKESSHDADSFGRRGKLHFRSCLCVPLKSRGTTLGVLSFVTAESGRHYDRDDLRVAEDLARRAVVAIENATLMARLKELDRRKDEFLALLAHELRNPLAPIRNAVQILRAKAPPVPEVQWAREVIHRQIEQMTRLVDDLLDASRITQGKIELRKQRVELAAVVNDAVEGARPMVEKWGHELTVEIPSEPVFLDGDPVRLAQILLNLLHNAAKYTDRGGRIWLTAQRSAGEVLIQVRDTGVGIREEVLPRIFEMFMQADRSLERSRDGLGIGLALAHRLVTMHGGTIEAKSAGAGTGAQFLVRLPVAVAQRADASAPLVGSTKSSPVLGQSILVVDDNQDSAESLAMLLRLVGHEVRTAHDGLAAVGAAEVFQPDVVLLDIGLPKLDGYEVARRIRAQRGDEVVLVALTGWGQQEDRQRAKDAGFDHHVTKPIEFEALKTLLRSIGERAERHG